MRMKTEENTEPNAPVLDDGAAVASAPSIQESTNPSIQVPVGPARQRRSAIARLPKATRRRINEAIDDGIEYGEIIASLGEDAKGLNTDIMHRWKIGGYQDYLREQRLLEQCRARQEAALELLTKNNPLNSFQATQQLASAQICEVLAEIGPEMFRDALTASPHNLFRMLNTFARLTNGGLKCERHLADEAERQERRTEAADSSKKSKKGMSKKSIREMKDRLSLM